MTRLSSKDDKSLRETYLREETIVQSSSVAQESLCRHHSSEAMLYMRIQHPHQNTRWLIGVYVVWCCLRVALTESFLDDLFLIDPVVVLSRALIRATHPHKLKKRLGYDTGL